ncbi:MAG: 7-cyano-7-deazaguanine synthase QueC [Nitrospirae bacterium]|nr:7-cyano-7-deazaguanine synthase QueC [Nitrospirota bacterium]MBI3351448.1 7-cyano-7-deazaguanine synthase QueC [Nitrospirota bacterium]
MNLNKVVILVSGGLDSTTVLAISKEKGEKIHALSFDYGQRHAIELESAKKITAYYKVSHKIITIDLRQIGGSALTDDIAVPKDRNVTEMSAAIPITYVPGRNTIFLSFAMAFAEITSSQAVYIGANVLDYSGYPDCRPDYLKAFEQMANLALATKEKNIPPLEIRTPLLYMTKGEIVKKGKALNIPFHLTHSCYDPLPTGESCGRCDSCLLRKKGFSEAGMSDPVSYAN